MTGELLNRAAGEPIAAAVAADQLERALERLTARHYDANRHRFDYGAAAVADEYDDLRRAVGALAAVDPAELPEPDAARAFWVNVYNALAVHIILETPIATSVREREDFFTGPHYCIHGHEVTLDAIEHGILRGNARKYMALKAPFGEQDPRRAWTFAEVDPRIHFVLYTGAVSSPPLRAVPGQGTDAALEQAAREHLAARVEVDSERGAATLPRLFRWYTGDFGGSIDDTLAFVRTRLDDARAETLAREDIDAAFAAFDWRLNDRYAVLE